MGTRSITQIRVAGEPLLTLYRLNDGYLKKGQGEKILELVKRKNVNGYTNSLTQYNGVQNFAAMLIGSLYIGAEKLECGDFYVMSDHVFDREQFNYIISFDDLYSNQQPIISVLSYHGDKLNMTVDEFETLVNNGFEIDE